MVAESKAQGTPHGSNFTKSGLSSGRREWGVGGSGGGGLECAKRFLGVDLVLNPWK